jgi:carbonic anhydrase
MHKLPAEKGLSCGLIATVGSFPSGELCGAPEVPALIASGLLGEMPQFRQRFAYFARRPAMTATDDLLKNAEKHAEGFDKGDLPMPPAKKVAIVACMDARVNPYPIFGLELGDAHVIRNAGGVVTDDEIRSLAISQRLLGTEEVILVHHTDCGMLTFNDEDFRRDIQEDTGIKPAWSAEAFDDLDADVRQSIKRIKSSPFIPNKDSIRGFIYEVETGRLREVT